MKFATLLLGAALALSACNGRDPLATQTQCANLSDLANAYMKSDKGVRCGTQDGYLINSVSPVRN